MAGSVHHWSTPHFSLVHSRSFSSLGPERRFAEVYAAQTLVYAVQTLLAYTMYIVSLHTVQISVYTVQPLVVMRGLKRCLRVNAAAAGGF